jgi:RNA polymerase sigma-70 factor (ECF subfamily)
MFSPNGVVPRRKAGESQIVPGALPREQRTPRDLFGEEEFRRAIKPHLTAMLTVAKGITGSRDLAWDAVQEALLTLWLQKKLPLDLRKWLVRTAANRSLHATRTRRRSHLHEKRASAGCHERYRGEDPEQALVRSEFLEGIGRALAALSPTQRAVLTMHEIKQMKYREIARILSVPVGTVRSRLNRARAALRDVLESPEDDVAS